MFFFASRHKKENTKLRVTAKTHMQLTCIHFLRKTTTTPAIHRLFSPFFSLDGKETKDQEQRFNPRKTLK
jgi:hypothetical protein